LRAGRSHAEVDVVGGDLAQIVLLVRPARPNETAPRPDQRLGLFEIATGPFEQAVDPGRLQRQVDVLRRYRLVRAGPVQGLQHLAARRHRLPLAVEPELVAAVADLDAETALDLAEVRVELTADAAQPLVVGGLQHKIQGLGVVRQALASLPVTDQSTAEAQR
jgi:hypothetical protein